MKQMSLYAGVLEFADSPEKRLLERTVARIAAQNNSPGFPLHLTVFGSLNMAPEDARDKASRAARAIRPFPVHFDRVAFGSDEAGWTRTAFLAARETPQLLAVRNQCERVFGVDGTWMPHASLYYSEEPLADRQRIVNAALVELDVRMPIELTASRFVMWDMKGPALQDVAAYDVTAHVIELAANALDAAGPTVG